MLVAVVIVVVVFVVVSCVVVFDVAVFAVVSDGEARFTQIPTLANCDGNGKTQ